VVHRRDSPQTSRRVVEKGGAEGKRNEREKGRKKEEKKRGKDDTNYMAFLYAADSEVARVLLHLRDAFDVSTPRETRERREDRDREERKGKKGRKMKRKNNNGVCRQLYRSLRPADHLHAGLSRALRPSTPSHAAEERGRRREKKKEKDAAIANRMSLVSSV